MDGSCPLLLKAITLKRSSLPTASRHMRLASRSRWEPIWEPIALDGCGRLWTGRPSGPGCVDGCGRLWTPFAHLRIRRLGIRVPPGVPAEPLRERGFLLSPCEVDSLCEFVGPRMGREVSGPDVIESSDERVDVGGESVGAAVHGHRDGGLAEAECVRLDQARRCVNDLSLRSLRATSVGLRRALR